MGYQRVAGDPEEEPIHKQETHWNLVSMTERLGSEVIL